MTAISQNASTALLNEKRFPLGLSERIKSIRSLYEEAKVARWDPYRDVAWRGLDATGVDARTAEAARRFWSQRAWTEYTGLAETPALLVRFCLELDREADPKYFLTVRNTEEAWSIECFHRIAEAMGGYLCEPTDAAWKPVYNQHLYKVALDARNALDPYVAVHCALEDGLEYDLFRAFGEHASQPVIRSVLDKVTASKLRHAKFGWLYLETRAARMDHRAREAVASHVVAWVGNVLWQGYHVPSLSSAIDTTCDVEDRRLLAAAGLGAAPAAEEEAVVIDALARARRRLAELDIELPLVQHPRLGGV